METKHAIIQLADTLVRTQGVNGFSFKHIASALHIKTASVHYHFATKEAMLLHLIEQYNTHFTQLQTETQHLQAREAMERYLTMYEPMLTQREICIVGALGSDYNMLSPALQQKLQQLSHQIVTFIQLIIERGMQEGVYRQKANARAEAELLLSAVTGYLQLAHATQTQNWASFKKLVLERIENS